MINFQIIQGRLTKDPDFRTTQSDVPCCRFTVAVDRDFARKGEEKLTDFFNVIAWRHNAEFVRNYFSKGQEILVQGSNQSRTYEDKDGVSRKVWELIADKISFCGSKRDNPQVANTSDAQTSGDFSDVENIVDEDLPF